MTTMNTTRSKKVSDILVAQINLRSSPAALYSLELLLSNERFDLIAISEPPNRLRTRDYSFGAYTWLRFLRGEANTGFLVKRNLNYSLGGRSFSRVFPLLMSSGKDKLGIISFYIKHTTGDGLNELNDSISHLKRYTNKVLVVGDGNGKSPLWSNVQDSNNVGMDIEELIFSNSLSVVNSIDSAPTFLDCSGNGHWIDLTLSTHDLEKHILSWQVVVGEVPTSDHELIVTHIKWATELSFRLKSDWKCVDWFRFSNTLKDSLYDQGLYSGLVHRTVAEIDESLRLLTEILSKHVDSIPKKRVFSKANGWYDDEIRQLHSEMKKARNLWAHHKTDSTRAVFLGLQNRFRDQAIMKKRASFWKFCSELSGDSMWDGLQRLSGKRKAASVDHVVSEDSLTVETDGIAIADALGKQFFNVANEVPINVPETQQNVLSEAFDEYCLWRNCNEDGIYHSAPTISEEDITETLMSGRNDSAAGIDGTDNHVLKVEAVAIVVAKALKPIFDSCLQLGYFPAIWKKASMVALIKDRSKEQFPSNFRPISLLSILGKKFERIINCLFTEHMESSRLWNEKQMGFRAGRGCIKALWYLVQEAHKAFRNGCQLGILSFDIRRAFDSVPTLLLWKKLVKLNLPLWMSAILGDFLMNREAYISIKGVTKKYELHQGVPQGSVLSPSLFNTYIDDVLSVVDRIDGVDGQLFADDLVVYGEVGRDGRSELQAVADALEKWSDTSFLEFNPKKTKLIRLSHLRAVSPISIDFCGERLNEEESVRYLGVVLDKKLHFWKHLEMVRAKAVARLMVIRKLGHRHFGSDPELLHRMVLSCIYPCLFYASEIWGHRTSVATFNLKLKQVVRMAALCITGALRSSPTDGVIRLASLPQPEAYVKKKLLLFGGKLFQDQRNLKEIPKDNRPETHLSPCSSLFTEIQRMSSDGCSPTDRNQWLSESLSDRKGMREFKKAVEKYSDVEERRIWNQSSLCRGLKQIGFYPPYKWFRAWKRNDTSELCQFLLDHWRSREYLSRFNPESSRVCRLCLCPDSNETRSHFFSCEFLRERRQLLLGNARFDDIDEMFEYGLDRLLDFVKLILVMWSKKNDHT